MSEYTIPAGYFPQLPECVTGKSEAGHMYHVGATSGSHIDGHLGHVFLVEGRSYASSGRHIDIVRDQRACTSQAWKAWCLARGFLIPWRYGATALHPMAKDY
jgi:hypothetical protein